MRWALVLSGGGARGMAHVGVIKELERRGFPPPSFIVGTSMGAIVGGMYASGWEISRMEEYALSFDIKKLVDHPAFRLPDVPLSRLVQAGAALNAFLHGRAVDSGKKAYGELQNIFGDETIESMNIPFACVSSDLIKGEMVVHDKGKITDAVRASMSFPGVFEPFIHDGAFLVDGGVLNNMPCNVAKEKGFKKILASDVSPFTAASAEHLSLGGIDVLMRCFDVAAYKLQSVNEKLAELVIVTHDTKAAFDFTNVARTIALGEKSAAEANLDGFFSEKRFGWIKNLRQKRQR